jgi:hypothetical protein
MKRDDANGTLKKHGVVVLRDRLARAKPFTEQQVDQRPKQSVSVDDFYAYMPQHTYIFVPTRDMWPAGSANARIAAIPLVDGKGIPVLDGNNKQKELRANLWLDANRPVEQMTWAPGLPMLIRNRLIAEGGWIERKGVTCFNLYRPPDVKGGDPSEAGRWARHVRAVYRDDAEHIVRWLAHRVQRPQEKINHALILGGSPGVGKDTLLEPVKHAVGPWNVMEVSPAQVLGRFNGFVKSVILRVSEARDLGDHDRFELYERLRVYTAAPPDVLRVDEKHLREYSVLNCCGVVITTNHKADGIFLPPDDRRHYVAWSERTKDEFPETYWNELWAWYEAGGFGHVAAFLKQLDISGFNPKAPPPKTAAFCAIIDAHRSPEDAELDDMLDTLGRPDVVAMEDIRRVATGDFLLWLNDRKSRRVVPHRLEKCRYVPVRNEDAVDGLWKIGGRRQAVYARADLALRDQITAVNRYMSRRWERGERLEGDRKPLTRLTSEPERAEDDGTNAPTATVCGLIAAPNTTNTRWPTIRPAARCRAGGPSRTSRLLALPLRLRQQNHCETGQAAARYDPLVRMHATKACAGRSGSMSGDADDRPATTAAMTDNAPLVMTAMFRVGRYECVFRFGEPGEPFMSVEWSPKMPRRLSPRHLRKYQRARDVAVAHYCEMTGRSVSVVDVVDVVDLSRSPKRADLH